MPKLHVCVAMNDSHSLSYRGRGGGGRGQGSYRGGGGFRGNQRGGAEGHYKHPPGQIDDDRQPSAPKKPRSDPPATAEEAGERQVSSLLTLGADIRSSSARWRIGAVQALGAHQAPRSKSLIERLKLIEREATLDLCIILEAALYKLVVDKQADLNEMRQLDEQLAKPRSQLPTENPPMSAEWLQAIKSAIFGEPPVN